MSLAVAIGIILLVRTYKNFTPEPAAIARYTSKAKKRSVESSLIKEVEKPTIPKVVSKKRQEKLNIVSKKK